MAEKGPVARCPRAALLTAARRALPCRPLPAARCPVARCPRAALLWPLGVGVGGSGYGRTRATSQPHLDAIMERFDDIEPHLPFVLDNIDVLAPHCGALIRHIDELLLYADEVFSCYVL